MNGTRHPKTALVTGASTGIGAEFARALAERGYSLVLVARRFELMTQLGAELGDRFGVTVRPLPADLAGPSGLAKVEERLRADGSGEDAPIDLLVNNAGRGGGGHFHRQETDELDAMIDLNIRAVTRLGRAALAAHVARRAAGEGRRPMGVINVSSLAGELPANPGGAVYGATKAFVTRWSESAAEEVAPHDLHVTAVLAGFVRTEMTREADLPDLAFVPKERIARESLRAWAAGHTSVVPDMRYRAARNLLRVLPGPAFKALTRRRR
ncbi:SDR family NAD(P)-dependent oxidoreductase [Halostreptopolyspora alba]|uniref:NADP-dependent 3-hydroxy acid dehydrogenase YdfG n=1 Tax=Halostreptopolyspora alba TaxID=2487137 RepID=A0A3N0E569_9ACTN|nr:SDR family NAD(P)-dependent oxidoreductase [Nocardiopsaceae bacterium YIM 96095]